MKKSLRLLCIITLITFTMSTVAFSASLDGKEIAGKGACLLDYSTGEVLFSHNGDVARVPASMTKIMTAYCVYDAIKNGEITPETIVPISERVYNMARNPSYQRVPLDYDQDYKVDELLRVLITYSPIAPAVALAELVGGDEASFVDRMNKKVAELGIDAFFYDSSGLANNEITPVAMAQLARNIIKDYPEILEITSKPFTEFRGKKYYSTNKFYTSLKYSGADGLKTGTTSASGYCFCGTAIRDGQRFIAVTMNSASATQRFVDVANMLDYGFATAKNRNRTLNHTHIRTFLDGSEVPTFVHGNTENAVILAEDLVNYGFDVIYDHNLRTLTVSKNKNKALTPIPMDYYRDKNGEVAYNIIENSVTVTIRDGDQSLSPELLLNVNGYIGFYVEELEKLYSVTEESQTYNISTSKMPG